MTEEDLIKQIGGYSYRCRSCRREWKSIWKLAFCTCGASGSKLVIKKIKREDEYATSRVVG